MASELQSWDLNLDNLPPEPAPLSQFLFLQALWVTGPLGDKPFYKLLLFFLSLFFNLS